MVDRSMQFQIPAPRMGNVELANIGKGLIQAGAQGFCFRHVKIKSAGIGQHNTFMMEAEMDRVGAQPVAVLGWRMAFTEEAQGTERRFFQSEQVFQCSFKRSTRLAIHFCPGDQPLQAGGGEFAEG